MSEKVMVALTGNPDSGKSTTARYLESTHGFVTVRVSNVIREYAEKNTMPLDCRDDYIRAHLAMAAEHGEGYDIQRVFQSDSDRICIDGVRIVRQVEELRKVGAGLIAHWCPLEVRFARSLIRGDKKDKPTLQGFRADEIPEYQSTRPPYPSVLTVMQMADIHIDTNRPESEVRQHIDNFLASRYDIAA